MAKVVQQVGSNSAYQGSSGKTLTSSAKDSSISTLSISCSGRGTRNETNFAGVHSATPDIACPASASDFSGVSYLANASVTAPFAYVGNLALFSFISTAQIIHKSKKLL